MSTSITTTLPTRATYRVATDRSECRFRARGMFGIPARGTMPIRTGTVHIQDGRAHVTAELDPAGFDSGIARRDEHVRSPQLLDVAAYPAIRFEGVLSADRTRVDGKLTVQDRTEPVTLAVSEVHPHPTHVDVVATTRVDRHECGITALKAIIARHVDIELTVTLVIGE